MLAGRGRADHGPGPGSPGRWHGRASGCLADRLRTEIGARGYLVEDTVEGVRVKRKDALQDGQ